jgi:hypothetical protein
MTLVTMRYPAPLWAELLGVVVIAAAIGSVLLLLRQFGGGNRSFPVEVALVIGAVVGSIIFIEFIRRSRLLWLLLGSRLEIFRTMERVVARVFLRVGLSLAVFASVLHLLVEPIPAARIAGIAAIFVGLTPLMLYIGMVSIRGIRWLETGLLLLAFGSGLVLVIQVLRPDDDLGTTVVIVGIQLSIAVALRYFARRRWITIDWIAFKPPPAGAGFLVS